ncbi:E3 ubiquitin-protein ligase SIAH1-like [Nycticebus coucang]|uniref:E3 ubiquitin-protein ligase SIAH1-like n=1 Tax=Nycticebus coucang TaxID=9470 RepID=UPI00234E18BD|nr:E3 ubiquitin-protein ligase SIAH1-like [Nycticebus coucang]
MSHQPDRAQPDDLSQDPPPPREPALPDMTPSSSELRSLFECLVCVGYVLPPIFQCQHGHLVCNSCRQNLASCPTCRCPLGSILNVAMEKLADLLTFPCKYASSGCGLTLPPAQKVDHEERCDFRPYCCPCPGVLCEWAGSLDAVMPHLMDQHDSITALEGASAVFLAVNINNVRGTFDWVMMQSCFGLHFMVVLQKQENHHSEARFCAMVQLLGTRQQAETFTYRLELRGDRRRLTWEAAPRSIREGIETAMINSDCLVFDTNAAQIFAENGHLSITVTIAQY